MTDDQTDLSEFLKDLRSLIDERLEGYSRLPSGCPDRLRDSMAYSLLAGGKRMRPLFVLLSCEACGGTVESALPAACALEMVHTYSLIHDDLPAMDDDDLRRGRPTNHVAFGEAEAILAGDALLTLAFEVMASEVRPATVAAECCADLARAAGSYGMVGGQLADLEAERSPAIGSLSLLQSIHVRKTGRLLASAMTLGARVANAEVSTIQYLERFGACIGLAFQITDDLLDLTGDSSRLGKEVRKDAAIGKLTYPGLIGLNASRDQCRLLVEEACDALKPLGGRSRHLQSLANFVIERDH